MCLPATGRPPAWLRDGQEYGGRWPPDLRLVQTVHKRNPVAPIAERNGGTNCKASEREGSERVLVQAELRSTKYQWILHTKSVY